MTRLTQLGSIDSNIRPSRRLSKRRRSVGLKPWLEDLENRLVLSTITWNTTAYPNGGNWDSPQSWTGGVVPGRSDTAEITGLTSPGTVYLDSGNADSVDSLITDSTTTLEVITGSLSLGVASSSTIGGSLIVNNGATLTTAADANLTVGAGVTITDNGTLNFAEGDSVALNGTTGGFGGGPGPAQISIASNGSGTLNAINTNFTTNGVGNITVGAGGLLTAANSTFTLSSLTWDDSSDLASGDLTGDTFNLPIFVPFGDVQYLSGNTSFEQINIESGTISTGTLALNLIGTNSTNLSYIFYQGFTVESGATMAVGINVPVVVSAGETITDNGTITFAAGDSVALNGTTGGFGGGPGPAQISIASNGSGTLKATNTNFTTNGVGEITIGAGGLLTAANSTFTLTSLSWDNSSLLGSGDLAGDTFNVPIYAPFGDVQYFNGNTSFEQIEIDSGTIASGTLALNLIGTNTTNLSYVFYQGFTVEPGATIAVGTNVPVVVSAGQTITDNGTITFATGDSVALDGTTGGFGGGPGPALISIASNGSGTLEATNTNFSTNGVGNITVGAGGQLSAAGSNFNLSTVTLSSGSDDTLTAASFSGQLDIDSGATIDISGDNFTNIGNQGVVATGDPNATINLADNYWGTTVSTQIEAKILDHSTDPTTRPTVNFQPYVSDTSGTVANSAVATFSPTDQSVTLTATVADSAGIVVNEGTETFTILAGTQVVGQTTTPAQVVNGAVSATYTLPGGTLPGQYIIEAYYSGSGSDYLPATDASHFLTVTPAAPYQLVIETPPSSTATAGQAFETQPVIYEEDKYGNVETGDSTTVVTAVIGEGTGPLQGTVTATVSGGVARFTNLYDDTAETITLKFASTDLASATSGSIAVSAAAASKVVFGQQPTNTTAGLPISPAVTARVEDAFNNLVTNDTSTVTLALSSGTIEAGATAVASGGVATFSGLTIGAPGSYTLSAADSTLTPSGASNSFTIDPPPTQVVIGQAPSNAIAGAAINPAVTVKVEDSSNNVVATDSSIVTLTLSNGTFAGGSRTATARASNGIATFTGLKINATGSYTLTATDGMLTPSDPSGSFTVSPAAAAKLVFVVPPYTSVIAGNPLTDPIVLDEEDQYGNVETSDNTTKVTASLATGAGNLYGTTQVTLSDGVASFGDLQDNTAGSLSLQFAAPSLPPVTSPPSIVTPAPASTLVIKRPPTGVISGGYLPPIEVDAQDPYGNLATSFNSPVSVAASAGNLTGTATMTAANGVANFTQLDSHRGRGRFTQRQRRGLTTGNSGGITIPVTTPQPPTISGSLIVDYTQKMKKGKKVGKPTFAGYTIDYSTTMNQGSIDNHSNYVMDMWVAKKGKKKTKVLAPVKFNVSSVTSNSVTLTFIGKQTFPNGGELTVIGKPGGVESAADVPLATNEIFTISKNGKKSSGPLP